MSAKYPASDEFIAWAESLSGMLTKISTTYGDGANLVEHKNWDQNRTIYFQQLIHSVSRSLETLNEELRDHVQ